MNHKVAQRYGPIFIIRFSKHKTTLSIAIEISIGFLSISFLIADW